MALKCGQPTFTPPSVSWAYKNNHILKRGW